jgi:16S rRNA (cytidine1402-2'-O)-methyltransferase
MQQGVSRSQASRQLAEQSALPRRQIYQLALTIADHSAPNPESHDLEP